jgi:hypothetical protein
MVRLLFASSFLNEDRCGKQRPRRQQVLSESENVVDEVKKSLHNLLSLLQMQRRLTKRCRVVFAGAAGLSESIFKN